MKRKIWVKRKDRVRQRYWVGRKPFHARLRERKWDDRYPEVDLICPKCGAKNWAGVGRAKGYEGTIAQCGTCGYIDKADKFIHSRTKQLESKNYGSIIQTKKTRFFVPDNKDDIHFIAKETLESPELILGKIKAGSEQQKKIFIETLPKSDQELVRIMKEKSNVILDRQREHRQFKRKMEEELQFIPDNKRDGTTFKRTKERRKEESERFNKLRKNYGMASFKINIGKSGQGEFASKVDFDPKKTVVHGTSEENALKIIKDRKLREGTYLYPGRGGFEDAAIWASNTRKKPVVIMVEADVDKPLTRALGIGWITLGKRGEEREGLDEIMDELPIKKIKIFKVPKNIAFNKGVLVEKKLK